MKRRKSVTRNLTEFNIYHSLKFFFILMQCFGMLPLEGLTNSLNNLHFKWRTRHVFYTFFVVSSLIFVTMVLLISAFESQFTSEDYVNVIFHVTGLTTIFLYLYQAIRFVDFLNEWCVVDKKLNECYGYPRKLNRKLKVVTVVMVVLLIGEFIFGYKFRKIPYPQTEANENLMLEVVNVLFYIGQLFCAFILTLRDLFIILLSIPLATRFHQINEDLVKHKEVRDTNYWRTVAKNYNRLAILCERVDKNISYIILLSFASNFIFVLIQLFYSLRTLGIDEKIYFLYSFFHLVTRLVAVSLYAAGINDESKEPTHILNSSHCTPYNEEIRGLLLQINLDNVALTGRKFFRITKGLILHISSAVVSYELVLVQLSTAVDEI